jgi:hypothetical protein
MPYDAVCRCEATRYHGVLGRKMYEETRSLRRGDGSSRVPRVMEICVREMEMSDSDVGCWVVKGVLWKVDGDEACMGWRFGNMIVVEDSMGEVVDSRWFNSDAGLMPKC